MSNSAMNTGTVLLSSWLLLACTQERVDLGGMSRAGSSSPPALMEAPAATRPLSATVSRPTSAASSPTLSISPRPSFAALNSRPKLTPPIAGGTLAVAADGGIAVASDPDRDLVFVIDPVGSIVRSVSLPSGSEPGRVVLDDIGQAHVVLRNADKLARIDLKSMQLMLSEPLCQQPRGIAYAAATKTLHVACADGQILQLAAADYAELARERHQPDLRDVVVLVDGTRAVSRFRNAQLLWLGPTEERSVSAPTLPWPKLTSTSTGGLDVSTVNTAASFAFRIASDANDGVWMLHERAQLDSLGDAALFHGQDPGCGPVVQPALSLFGKSNAVASTRVDLQLQGAAAPAVDIAFAARDQWVAIATPAAFAANRATVQLQQLDLLQKEATIRTPDLTQAEFGGMVQVCSPPTFIPLELGKQAVAVAFDQNGLLYVQSRYPPQLDVYLPMAADPSSGKAASAHWNAAIMLAIDEVRDLGHEWFHAELGTSGLSCAACHAEGLDDAHTWISGTSARRTPNLRGGIKDTAPFFWNGVWQSFDALATDVITRQIAAPSISGEAAEAMLAWLTRLPALSLESNDTRAGRGMQLFESSKLGCTSCHSGAQLTNNQSVSAYPDAEDAGIEAEAIQVPSLLGLALRAPYMHDGCASDLEQLFHDPACARPMHHELAAMSGEDAAALQAYLLSL